MTLTAGHEGRAFEGGHPDGSTLDRWRTGELAGPERERVAAHLAGCEACARALAELEGFARAVGRAYAADRAIAAGAEPDWARVRARIAEATGSMQAPAPARRPARAAWGRWAPQAAAAVLALIVVGVLWREGVRGPEDAERVARPASEIADGAAGPTAARPSAARPSEPGPVGPRDAPAPTPATPPTDDLRRNAPAGLQDRAEPSREAAQAERLGQDAAAAQAAPPPAAREREERADLSAKAAGVESRAEAAVIDPHDRFAVQAREAILSRDTPLAYRTLALWRDTLAPKGDLDQALLGQAQALADSLAAFLATPR